MLRVGNNGAPPSLPQILSLPLTWSIPPHVESLQKVVLFILSYHLYTIYSAYVAVDPMLANVRVLDC